ncbi:MAG: hypothetical protein KDC95_05685 [Planctomycetes bacterium]|nr:hypothetical protein [Planctomycetota bacterium]
MSTLSDLTPTLAPTLADRPTLVHDDAQISCSFNVMNDRPVTETLHVHHYEVTPHRVLARFDRDYRSSMRNSPDHLVFLTALAHTQKMLYLALCAHFGFEYDPDGPERLKMWPTKVEVSMPKLCDQIADVVQVLDVLQLRRIDDRTYRARIETRVGDALCIRASVPVFLI